MKTIDGKKFIDVLTAARKGDHDAVRLLQRCWSAATDLIDLQDVAEMMADTCTRIAEHCRELHGGAQAADSPMVTDHGEVTRWVPPGLTTCCVCGISLDPPKGPRCDTCQNEHDCRAAARADREGR